MDPLSVTASIIACVQLSGYLCTLVGPSSYSTKDLTHLHESLERFRCICDLLKSHLEINQEDETRLSALEHLQKPAEECRAALAKIERRLEKHGIGKYVVGSFWDGNMKKCLKRLDEARSLFEIALQADRQ